MFTVYVIKNEQSSKIYIGQTADLANRLKRHSGELPSKPKSYTKINKGAWNLVFQEILGTRMQAISREKFLKSQLGRNWLRTKVGS